jgi:hypothetical protein
MKRFLVASIFTLASASVFAASPSLSNGSFESNSVGGGYAYGNVAAGWSFTGGSGVSSNHTAWGGTTSSGSHFAFLQNTARIAQSFVSTSAFNYTFFFDNALRALYDVGQTVVVQLDGNQIGTFTPTTSWSSVSVSALNVGAGSHTLAFLGTNPTHASDTSAFIDNVSMSVSPVPEPETYALTLAGLGLLGSFARRRKQKNLAA